MSDMREEFEEWAVSEGMPITRGHYYDVYASAETRAAYLAWQAARTVPEGYVMVPVELLDRLPELNEFNYSHDDVCELNAWGVELVLSAAPEGKK